MSMDSDLLIYTAVTGFGALLGLVATVAYVWYLHTDLVIKMLTNYYLFRAGCETKYVKIGDLLYCYAEHGRCSKTEPSMLLVHAFSASKDMWVQTVSNFPKDLHCIMVDLAGHGDTTIPEADFDVSFDRSVEELHKFVEAVNLDGQAFHLVGLSMGGTISESYAVRHPEKVALLTLICPAMRTPEMTEFQREISPGHCPLVVDDVDGLRRLYDRLTYSKLHYSNTMLKGLIKISLPRNEFLTKVFDSLQAHINVTTEGTAASETVTSRIEAPTQVVWGEHDELIHVSGAELLRSRLQHCARVDILERCGHSCNIDRPGLLAKCLLQFRNEYSHKKQH